MGIFQKKLHHLGYALAFSMSMWPGVKTAELIYVWFFSYWKSIRLLSCSSVGGKCDVSTVTLHVTLHEASSTRSPAGCPASRHALSILPCMHSTTACAHDGDTYTQWVYTHLRQSIFAISCKLARHHSGDAERIRVDTERVKLFRIF
jgi:hypothetical protein